MNSGLKYRLVTKGACGGQNAKRQTPNIKLQMGEVARAKFVWRLAFGAAGTVVERIRLFADSALRLIEAFARASLADDAPFVERIVAPDPYQLRCILHISPCPSI